MELNLNVNEPRPDAFMRLAFSLAVLQVNANNLLAKRAFILEGDRLIKFAALMQKHQPKRNSK